MQIKRMQILLILMLCNVKLAYAHGEQMLFPFTANIVAFLIIIRLLFKRTAGWKYRTGIFVGGLLSIWFTWLAVDLIWIDYYFKLLDNVPLMTFAFYAVQFLLFGMVYYFSERFLKPSPTNK